MTHRDGKKLGQDEEDTARTSFHKMHSPQKGPLASESCGIKGKGPLSERVVHHHKLQTALFAPMHTLQKASESPCFERLMDRALRLLAVWTSNLTPKVKEV